MLGLILFNLGGYALLFQYLINRTDNTVYERINDNQYKTSDLVDVRIPVNFKTFENADEYAPIGGQIKLSDTVYNFAYLKITKDTLYLLCLPNREKARIKNAKIIYAKQINDISLNQKSHAPVMKLSTFESDHNYSFVEFRNRILEKAAPALANYTVLNIIKTSIGVPGQPPEVSDFQS
jgi:hypothetical protein